MTVAAFGTLGYFAQAMQLIQSGKTGYHLYDITYDNLQNLQTVSTPPQ